MAENTEHTAAPVTPQPANESKIESAFGELINFLVLFFKTYLNIVLKPVKFLKSMQPGSEVQVEKVGHIVFFLVSAFFFVLSVDIINNNTHILTNIFRNVISDKFVDIFNFEGLNDYVHITINQIVNISILKVIFVTLPLVAWVFFYIVTFSVLLFKDKEQRKVVRRSFKYFTSAAFFSLIIIFMWEFFLLKFAINPLTKNHSGLVPQDVLSVVTYGLPGLFYIYLLFLPMLASWQAFPKEQKALRRKYMTISLILIPLFLLNFKVCVFQNNIDAMFDPLPIAQKVQQIEFIYISPIELDTVNSRMNLDVIILNKNAGHIILGRDSAAIIQFEKATDENKAKPGPYKKTDVINGGGGSSQNGGPGQSSIKYCSIYDGSLNNNSLYSVLMPGDFKSIRLIAVFHDEDKLYFNNPRSANQKDTNTYGYIVTILGLTDDAHPETQQFSADWQKIHFKYAVKKEP